MSEYKLYKGDCLEVMDKLIEEGVACMNTNRQFIGIEKDKKYFNIAKKRIEDAEEELNK